MPTLQGEPYLDKPPLFYWLVMASYRLFGVHDWAARWCRPWRSTARILLTYLLGRRSVGERPAFWGRLLLALCPGFVGMGRLLVLDGLLTFWVTAGPAARLRGGRGGHAALGLVARWRPGLRAGRADQGAGRRLLLLCRRCGCTAGWRTGQAASAGAAGCVFAAVVLAWSPCRGTSPSVCACPSSPATSSGSTTLQRFLAAVRHIRAGLVLRADPAARPAAGDPAAGAVRPLLAVRDDHGAQRCRRWVSAAGRRLVRAVLLAVGLQAADVHLARVSPAGAGPRAYFWPRGRGARCAGSSAGLAVWWLVSVFGHGVLLPAFALEKSPMADWQRMTELCATPGCP